MKRYTEEQLIVLFTEGASEAFEELLKRYGKVTYSYILAKVKQGNLADDIYQEFCIKVMDRLKRNVYVNQGKFGAWLIRIAHNLVIDYFRKQRASNVLIDSDSQFDALSQNTNNEIGLSLGEKEAGELRKLICLLPTEQREVLFMRYYMGLTHREIADHLKIGINTALGRMRYAIANIQKMIEKDKTSTLKGLKVA
ncbi:MAG: RNA polymerase sigma factor [Bacteroidales bacterium]